MSRYAGNKSASGNGSSQVWAGIFVGMVIGAGMAAVFSWYMMKSPSPLLNKGQPAATPSPGAPANPPAQTASEKTRFEFYNVLTDKAQKGAAPAKQTNQEKQVAQSKPAEATPAEAKMTYTPKILQVGSFSTAVDAEKLKARLAMIGAESHIQTANVPDRGVYYRVRLGPYKSEEELNRARNFLKQNDLESTPMRAQ